MEAGKRVYYIKKVSDGRGVLTFATLCEDVPFAVKRIFWITDVPENATRGGHAHKTCHEVVFAVSGSLTLDIEGNEKCSLKLGQPSMGVLIRAGEWCLLRDFAPGTVVLVLASEEYDASGYLLTREECEVWNGSQRNKV